MSKLNLNLDDLTVDSFSTDGSPEPRGTVVGQAETYELVSCYDTGCNTCDDYTCNNTCDYTCDCGGGGDTGIDGSTCNQIVCV